MSTRCHIVVKNTTENKKHYVYHHCDGYLDGVGKELKEFIKDKYQPTHYTSDEFCKQIENWNCSYEYEDCGIHGDEEYIYHVEIDNDNHSIIVSAEKEKHEKDENGKWKSWWEDIGEYKESFNIE